MAWLWAILVGAGAFFALPCVTIVWAATGIPALIARLLCGPVRPGDYGHPHILVSSLVIIAVNVLVIRGAIALWYASDRGEQADDMESD